MPQVKRDYVGMAYTTRNVDSLRNLQMTLQYVTHLDVFGFWYFKSEQLIRRAAFGFIALLITITT